MREDIPLAVPQLTEGCHPAPRQAGWIVAEPRWDAYYAVVFAACVAIVEAGKLDAAGRIACTAALAAMVPWYLFLGRPLMSTVGATRATGARGIVYLAGLVVLFTIAQSQNANAWFLAFALLPMCFHVTTLRHGLVFVVILNVIAGALVVRRDPGLPGALTAVGIVVFAVSFSYAYSRWVMKVIEQSLERAALIEQLEATRAELAAAHHEAGVQAERHRLAGEIHDTLAQGFTSIVTLLQAAQASLGDASPARRHLDLALVTARENLAEARTLVTTLTPAPLEAGTLGDSVHRVTGATGAQAGIVARAEVTGTPRRLPTGTEVVLLRVCQEALANVRQHAAAHQVRVRLCYGGSGVRLTVTDDGKGFDPAGPDGGYGLKGMADRVGLVGGTVEVTSAPGAGTEVRAEVPG
ncbi:MAG TPA: sensor histidine kinase [Streptosporangiaceae bacterium]|nr:sensor histidine kinase [Streptosporangiaceae bacterium]